MTSEKKKSKKTVQISKESEEGIPTDECQTKGKTWEDVAGTICWDDN